MCEQADKTLMTTLVISLAYKSILPSASFIHTLLCSSRPARSKTIEADYRPIIGVYGLDSAVSGGHHRTGRCARSGCFLLALSNVAASCSSRPPFLLPLPPSLSLSLCMYEILNRTMKFLLSSFLSGRSRATGTSPVHQSQFTPRPFRNSTPSSN